MNDGGLAEGTRREEEREKTKRSLPQPASTVISL